MGKFAVVPSAQLYTADSWGAKFHILSAEHAPAVGELLSLFTTEEMLALAADLPFDEGAANAVFMRNNRVTRSALLDAFAPKKDLVREEGLWFEKPEPRPELPREIRARRIRLAVYCAAAAHGAKNKIAEELLELSRQKLAVVERLHAIHTTAAAKGAKALKAALVRNDRREKT